MRNRYEKELIHNTKMMCRKGDFMEIKIDINTNVKACPYCLGSGKLKAMQSVAISYGWSVRGKDTQVECIHCKGTGLVI